MRIHACSPACRRPGERQRITAAGGRVTRLATDRYGNPAGPFRVFVPNAWSPGLALSRAFGDTRELAADVDVMACGCALGAARRVAVRRCRAPLATHVSRLQMSLWM